VKKLLFTFFLLLNAIACRLFAQDGKLDSTFSNDGIVTTDLGGHDVASGVAVRPDGRVVVAGYSSVNNWTYFALAQYKIDGTLDSTFGSDGIVLTTFSEPSYGGSIALQPDGKIVVGGGSYIFWLLARYNEDGSLDSTFGINGEVTTETLDYDVAIMSLIIEEDGKILAIGYSGETQPMSNVYYSIAVARYNSDGTLEDGIAYYGSSEIDRGYSACRQSDGKIVISSVSEGALELLRVDSNLYVDNTFANNGFETTQFVTSAIPQVAIQSDARIILVSANNSELLINRFTAGGLPDTSFGDGGNVTTPVTSNAFLATSVAIVEGDKIQVAGTSDESIVVARYKADGNLDSSFGTNGITITDFASEINEVGTAMAIAPGGKIVVAASTNSDFLVARYNSSLEFVNVGDIDNTFRNNSAFIYPNPIEENATLKYSLKNEAEISIQLLDVEGRVLKTFVANERQLAGDHEQKIIFPEGLASGSYLIVISSPNGSKLTVKVAK